MREVDGQLRITRDVHNVNTHLDHAAPVKAPGGRRQDFDQHAVYDDTVPNTTVIRRQSVLSLFQEYAAAKIAAGEPAKGIEQAFAAELEISPSMWSQIKSSRSISDKLARQIESHMRRPTGWLDEQHGLEGPDPAEERFIELARTAWRSSNAAAKRELLRLVRHACALREG
jgi:hypothetical protein